MNTRLDLLFSTTEGKTYRISIDDPILNLDAAVIEASMTTILNSNVIVSKYGALNEIKSARYVSTTVTDVSVPAVV